MKKKDDDSKRSRPLGVGVKKEIHARYIKRFRTCKWTSIHGKSQNALF